MEFYEMSLLFSKYFRKYQFRNSIEYSGLLIPELLSLLCLQTPSVDVFYLWST